MSFTEFFNENKREEMYAIPSYILNCKILPHLVELYSVIKGYIILVRIYHCTDSLPFLELSPYAVHGIP